MMFSHSTLVKPIIFPETSDTSLWLQVSNICPTTYVVREVTNDLVDFQNQLFQPDANSHELELALFIVGVKNQRVSESIEFMIGFQGYSYLLLRIWHFLC
jgi:hypothetical protein